MCCFERSNIWGISTVHHSKPYIVFRFTAWCCTLFPLEIPVTYIFHTHFHNLGILFVYMYLCTRMWWEFKSAGLQNHAGNLRKCLRCHHFSSSVYLDFIKWGVNTFHLRHCSRSMFVMFLTALWLNGKLSRTFCVIWIFTHYAPFINLVYMVFVCQEIIDWVIWVNIKYLL